MIARKLVTRVTAVTLAALALGLSGCTGGSGEIPLAKVPPPPPGFGDVKKSANAPKSGSAENAQDYYK
jgi:hypothetical protein